MRLHLATQEDLKTINVVIATALRARLRAYAPYSKYLVGAAIVTATGEIFAGCNVESADYDGTHAEESALAAMVLGGYRSPVRLVAFGGLEDNDHPTHVMPCGKCRQKLWEFASLSGTDLRMLMKSPTDPDQWNVLLLSDLLPEAFGPADIGVELTRYRR